MVTRREVKGSKGVAGDLTGILLTDGFFNHDAPALRCDECGTVVVLPRHWGADD